MRESTRSFKLAGPVAALAAALALFVALAGAGFGAAAAYAAQDSTGLAAGTASVQPQAAPKLVPETLWVGSQSDRVIFIKNLPAKAKITKVVSKNTKVITAKLYSANNNATLHAKKAGKSKVSVTYKVNGKSKTLSATYTAKAFPNAFKSVTLNGKAIAYPNAKNKNEFPEIRNFSGTAATIKVIPAKGWKIAYMSGGLFKANGTGWKNIKVKNNKKFTVTKGKNAQVFVNMKNSKGDMLYCSFTLDRRGEVWLDSSTLFVGQVTSPYINASEKGQTAQLVSVTSSNPNVIRAEQFGTNIWSADLTALKTGTSTIKMTYKLGGKNYSTSGKYTVKKYSSPFSSLLVNGKKVNVSSNKYYYQLNDYASGTAKVKATPAKGWKIVYSSYYNSKGANGDYKNGASITVPKGGSASATFGMQNSAGDMLHYSVNFNR